MYITFNVRLRASRWRHCSLLSGDNKDGDWGSGSVQSSAGETLIQTVRRLASMSRVSPSMSTFDRLSVSNNSQTSVSANQSINQSINQSVKSIKRFLGGLSSVPTVGSSQLMSSMWSGKDFLKRCVLRR